VDPEVNVKATPTGPDAGQRLLSSQGGSSQMRNAERGIRN
jgi:hypothetical protein